MVSAVDIVLGRLAPARMDDLTPRATGLVGQTFRWTATRVIDYSDAYDGLWRMELGAEDYEQTGLWWAPLCDLADVVKVDVDDRVAREHALLYADGSRVTR